YWDRNSSGKQTIRACWPAASRTKSVARSKFLCGSGPHCIWTSAIFVLEPLFMLGRLLLESLDIARRYNFHRTNAYPVNGLTFFSCGVGGHRGVAHPGQNVVSPDHFSESGVFAVPAWDRSETNEELRAGGIRTFLARHRDDAPLVFVLVEFRLYRIAR